MPLAAWRRQLSFAKSFVSLGCATFALFCGGAGLHAQEITSAEYVLPTDRYAHAVLGDAIEWGGLRLTLSNGQVIRFELPQTLVFEDTAPRLADLDQDGAPEVIVVEADLTKGARLAVYDATGRIAVTPHIGQRHRWLAPIGAADFDSDGLMEIAYIDRPHLAKTLRIWRFEDGQLNEIASHKGLTNHKIGWDYIVGGVRLCADRPEIIVASADWARVVAAQVVGSEVRVRDLSSYTGPASIKAALDCS